MNVIIEEINEFPRFHLSNYFDELKNEIENEIRTETS